jgi:hypothetical protein
MTASKDWLPGARDGQVAMAKKRPAVMVPHSGAWGAHPDAGGRPEASKNEGKKGNGGRWFRRRFPTLIVWRRVWRVKDTTDAVRA